MILNVARQCDFLYNCWSRPRARRRRFITSHVGTDDGSHQISSLFAACGHRIILVTDVSSKMFPNLMKRVFNKRLKSICAAISQEDIEIETVQEILSKSPEIIRIASSNRSDSDVHTKSPLWEAVFCREGEIVELLLNFGADANELIKIEKDNHSLHLTVLQFLACLCGFSPCNRRIAEILIRHGANVNAYSVNHDPNRKNLPIKMAIECGNIEFAEFLIKNKACFQGAGWERDSILFSVLSAPKSAQTKILQLLIQNGFDTKVYDKDRRTCLHAILINCALRKFNGININTIDIVGIVRMLLDYGAPLHALEKNEQSALYMSVVLRNFELVSFLIQRGADVCQKDFQGTFPLLLAISADKNIEFVDLLLTSGADIKARGNLGQTVLHAACYWRNENIINFLIRRGAEISIENNEGETPFSMLHPEKYEKSNVPCIHLMIKETARRCVLDNRESKKDVDIIQMNEKTRVYYENCKRELVQMANIKFFPPLSYCSVLKMSNNIKKLACLVKNEVFVLSFGAYLGRFPIYQSDLQKIWKEALESRDNFEAVKFRLKSIFDDLFPDLVIRKLTENLSLKDLPFQ